MVNLLSLIISLPIIGAGLVLMLNRDHQAALAKKVSLLFSLLSLALCWPLIQGFSMTQPGFQWVEKYEWIPSLGAYYHLGVDGFSLPLIVLTIFFSPIIIVAGWQVIQKQVAYYMAAFLFLQGFLCGVFMALDTLVFYLFWEALLIPMFLIIGIWGGPNRVYASLKFFLYTFLGSVFLLIALLYLAFQAKQQGFSEAFSLLTFYQLKLSPLEQAWLFLGMVVSFAVKVPMWPVHTWLPDAHVEAPTGGSVILAAIMLKLGTYGLLRFVLPITPLASYQYSGVMIVLSLIAIVYIGLVALVQSDMKKLIAYSSIAHMGFVTLGLFMPFALLEQGALNAAHMAIDGAYVQMISHGFISGALFLCVGVLYDRLHSRQIQDYGGVAARMPQFAFFAVFFAMANCGLPGTSGFVGEFLVIISAFSLSKWVAATAALTLLLGAGYSLWMVKRVIFGPITQQGVASLTDINGREKGILAVLALAVLLLGVWPAPLLESTQISTDGLLQQLLARSDV